MERHKKIMRLILKVTKLADKITKEIALNHHQYEWFAELTAQYF